MANGKDIKWGKWIICILSLVAVVLSALIYNKVNKKCEKQPYIPMNKLSRMKAKIGINVKDIGPSAGGNRDTNPPADFVSGCQNAFASGCATPENTVNVCGGYDSNNNLVINCQDYTNMDDQSCNNATYVAYESNDCSQPYQWVPGYLCGGGSGDPSSNPCPSGGNVVGPAPSNPYGCTNICQ